MKKWRVYGRVTVSVYKTVEAATEDEAIDKAYTHFGGISGFCGNGGTDKLIGVYGSDEAIEGDGEIEFTEAEEI